MSDTLITYYDNFYSKNKNPFGKNPTEILPLLLKYKSNGCVLDCGAGDGRNSLFLAKQGFIVDAVDFSSVACEQLEKVAREQNVPVHTHVADITKFELAQQYGVIVCAFMLQHLKRSVAVALVERLKKNTAPNGVNVMCVQTVAGDFFRLNPETENFFDTGDQLKELYADWQILEYYKNVKQASIKKPDGTHAENECVFMMAQNKA